MQYAYPDGGMSDTDVIVDLFYAQNQSQTVRLINIHVHVPVCLLYLGLSFVGIWELLILSALRVQTALA